MTIGTSLFLIAVGAILRYAVTATVAGVDIQTAGLILIVIGIVGLVIGLFLMVSRRDDRAVVVDDRPVDPRYR
jgi:hydrogenase-4 membrane subunit HyfE